MTFFFHSLIRIFILCTHKHTCSDTLTGTQCSAVLSYRPWQDQVVMRTEHAALRCRPGCEQYAHTGGFVNSSKISSKCYNKHTLHIHTPLCCVRICPDPVGKKKNPFETRNCSPSAAPVLPSTRPGAEQQQPENTGLCCLSRSPLDTFLNPFSQGTRQHRGLVVLRSM